MRDALRSTALSCLVACALSACAAATDPNGDAPDGGGGADAGTPADTGAAHFTLTDDGTVENFPIIVQAAMTIQITARTNADAMNLAQVTLRVPATVGTHDCPSTETNPPTTFISYMKTINGTPSGQASAGIKGEGSCTVTLTEVGTKAGDFAVGTFSASLVGMAPHAITSGSFKVALGVTTP
jgi:hypothetical protein